MIFLDTHSLKIHRELNQEIEKLETQKKELKNLIEKDLRNIDQLVINVLGALFLQV